MKPSFIVIVTLAFLTITTSAKATFVNFTNSNYQYVLSEKNVNNSSVTEKTSNFCRACCTLTGADQYGTYIEITACSGWLLTSCETAADKACLKALNMVFDLLMEE